MKTKTLVLLLSREFMKNHPKSGQPTNFEQKILSGEKIHTIRANYEYWFKRIENLKKSEGILSIRQWSGKPYRSQQIVIKDIPASDIGIQEIKFKTIHDFAKVDSAKLVQMNVLSANDGLLISDFKKWFEGYNLNYPMAIIHFTNFKY